MQTRRLRNLIVMSFVALSLLLTLTFFTSNAGITDDVDPASQWWFDPAGITDVPDPTGNRAFNAIPTIPGCVYSWGVGYVGDTCIIVDDPEPVGRHYATFTSTIMDRAKIYSRLWGEPLGGVASMEYEGSEGAWTAILAFEPLPPSNSFNPTWDCNGDTKACAKKVDDMCEAAGHTGGNQQSIQIRTGFDGSVTCSGNCASGNAVAFKTCSICKPPPACPAPGGCTGKGCP